MDIFFSSQHDFIDPEEPMYLRQVFSAHEESMDYENSGQAPLADLLFQAFLAYKSWNLK